MLGTGDFLMRNNPTTSRRGAILVLSCFLIIVMVGLVAFTVDLGYIELVRTQLQASVDSAALAGASQLVNGTAAANTEALNFVSQNSAGGKTLSASNTTVEFGNWDPVTRTFTVSNSNPNGVRITASLNQQPTFFAKMYGMNSFNTSAQAIAVYQPRDIALALDYSGSMCFDSQLCSIGSLGQAAVEANILQIYQQLGSPVYGTLTFTPVAYGTSSTSNSSVKSKFGLTSVAYPYPRGSWDEYIDYVQSDRDVQAAGYRNKYGYLTWINYLQSQRNYYSETPVLWQVSEQPITSIKDATDVFLSYLTAHCTDDRVALSIYTYSDMTAILEQALTTVYTNVSTKVRQRQAGHYTGGTNISAGMNKARLELQNNGRAGALKMLVLMTDGEANLPSGNPTSDKNAVITEANSCAAAKIKVITICVGASADTSLMQQIADITGGAAFIIPGGQTVAQVKAQLEAVFGQVARDRPLKLVY